MAKTIPLKKKRNLLVFYIFGLIFLVGILAVGGAYMWYNNAVSSTASTNTDTFSLRVNAGETLLDIAPKIQQAGGLTSIEALKIYMRLNNVNVALQIGTYEIPLNRNIPGLIAELQNGPRLLSVSATIREGLRAEEIADELALAFKDVSNATFTSEKFTDIVNNPDSYDFPTQIAQFLELYKPQGKPLEGFLFPDTYNIGVDASAMDVVSLILSNLLARMEENDINPATDTNRLPDFYSVLNMASIVEREAFGIEESKMVADILIRRLNEGIGLFTDATILYPYKRWTPGPTEDELRTDTAYNTRLHFGMPPTPIANPGIEAIKAVINPTANQYYYYLHDKNGIIRYGRDLNEHNANVRNYLL